MNIPLWMLIKSDIAANPRNPKGISLCVLYRIAHSVASWPRALMPLGYIIVFFYKIITEYIIGTEIHWRTSIGPGLCIWHGYGLVVHSNAIIGANCTLRQGVTIGAKGSSGSCAPTIGDRVNFGVSALVIGAHNIGDDVTLGAGTVVVFDAPAGAIVVGNPGRILSRG